MPYQPFRTCREYRAKFATFNCEKRYGVKIRSFLDPFPVGDAQIYWFVLGPKLIDLNNLCTRVLSFYRVTLCVSAVFACRPVSVSLSVTFVHSIQTAEDIVKLLVQLGSSITLVFDPMRRYPIPREPLQRGRKIQGEWENVAIFNGNRRLSRKRYEIGPWLPWNVNRKSYALYRMVTF